MPFSHKGENVPVYNNKDHCAAEATRYLKHVQNDHRKHHANCIKSIINTIPYSWKFLCVNIFRFSRAEQLLKL